MPVTGMHPSHFRTNSLPNAQAVSGYTRNRAATEDLLLNPIALDDQASEVEAGATEVPHLTGAEHEALVKCLYDWQYDGKAASEDELDTFHKKMSDLVTFDGDQFVLGIQDGEPPVLPECLAEKRDPLTGAVVEKAKVKFVFPPPDFGYGQPAYGNEQPTHSTEAGRQRNISEQKFPLPQDTLPPQPFPLPGPESLQALAGQAGLLGRYPEGNFLAAVTPRSSASGSPRSSMSDPSPRTSERLSNWGLNLLGRARPASPTDAPSLAMLETTPKLSEHVLTTPQTKELMSQLQAEIQALAKAKHKTVAVDALKVLNRVPDLASRPHKLDCLNALTLNVIHASLKSTSTLAGEKTFFDELDRQLTSIRTNLDRHDSAEHQLFAALSHFAVERGRASEE